MVSSGSDNLDERVHVGVGLNEGASGGGGDGPAAETGGYTASNFTWTGRGEGAAVAEDEHMANGRPRMLPPWRCKTCKSKNFQSRLVCVHHHLWMEKRLFISCFSPLTSLLYVYTIPTHSSFLLYPPSISWLCKMCCSSRDLEASPPLCVPIDKCDGVVLEKPIPLVAQIRDCEARWAQEMEDEVSENQKADARRAPGAARPGWVARAAMHSCTFYPFAFEAIPRNV